MGVDKALLEYHGLPLVEVARRCLEAVGLSVRIVADSAERFKNLKLPVVVDRVSHVGPLAGIATALNASGSKDNYFIPCDTPLMSPRLYRVLGEASKSFDVVVPRDGQGRIHPLCAYYSRVAMAPIQNLLGKGIFKVDALLRFKNLQSHVLPATEFGISDLDFFNVNTLTQWEHVKKRN